MENRLTCVHENLEFLFAEYIAILTFHQTFKRECNVLRIHAGVAMWLLKPLLGYLARATIQMCMAREGYKAPRSLTTYLQVERNLLGTYGSDEIVT